MILTAAAVTALYIAVVVYIIYEIRRAPFWDDEKQKFVEDNDNI